MEILKLTNFDVKLLSKDQSDLNISVTLVSEAVEPITDIGVLEVGVEVAKSTECTDSFPLIVSFSQGFLGQGVLQHVEEGNSFSWVFENLGEVDLFWAVYGEAEVDVHAWVSPVSFDLKFGLDLIRGRILTKM